MAISIELEPETRERVAVEHQNPGCRVSVMLTITSISTSAGYDVTHLTDADLLANTRSLVGRSNQLLSALLLHLGEVEARGLHRVRALWLALVAQGMVALGVEQPGS